MANNSGFFVVRYEDDEAFFLVRATSIAQARVAWLAERKEAGCTDLRKSLISVIPAVEKGGVIQIC